uniref:RNA helicase n=1 Tax=Ditylum brightwellii TaxID=49249 RepID=A0A7S4UVP1_9STRA
MASCSAFVQSPTMWCRNHSHKQQQLLKTTNKNTVRHSSTTESDNKEETEGGVVDFFADESTHPTFQSVGITSPVLLSRLESPPLQLKRPSAVQASSFVSIAGGGDVTIGAETGSGKTFAYLLPILDDILQRKKNSEDDYYGYDYGRAVILVPNKELANQVVRMASTLCGGLDKCLLSNDRFVPPSMMPSGSAEDGEVDESDIVRITIMPGGLKAPEDFRPFRSSRGLGGEDPAPDIIVTTPASLGPLALSPKNIDLFADIQTLIIDEADMLLDGGYIRQLENVLMGFRRADRLANSSAEFGASRTQHVFVAATLPDMGLKSVDSFLKKRFPYAARITMAGMHNARHYGLRERTVWIEDEDGGSNKERMQTLVKLLNTPREEGGLDGEKVMVFLNSVEDVDGATNAFRRGGINAVPYHAKIQLAERSSNLDKFRRYKAEMDDGLFPTDENDEGNDAVPVLVCTDLAARGLDVPGVTAVVQLQFAGNVVAHLHRMGRCGRAGNRDGRGVIFYGQSERELVEVVREAEAQQERMTLEGDVMDEEETGEDGAKKKKRRRGICSKSV